MRLEATLPLTLPVSVATEKMAADLVGQTVPVSMEDREFQTEILSARVVEAGVLVTFEVPDDWAPTLYSKGWNLSTTTSE